MLSAWDPEKLNQISAIEVYPAATLQCYGIRNAGYKAKEQEAQRNDILNGLLKVMDIQCNLLQIRKSADVLDSAVCLLAATNFLNGDVCFPSDSEKAKKEGWIWVKNIHPE